MSESMELEWFIEKCKSFGLKITPQRIAIFKEVLSSSEHPSAEKIYSALKKSHPNLSFDTVYRTLLTFVEMGLIQVVSGTGDSRRFDPMLKEHHHMVCLKCGSIIDFDYEEYNNLKAPTNIPDSFSPSKVRVVIEGICKNCQDAK